MLWLFNSNSNFNKDFKFYQVFVNYDIVYELDGNKIYSFGINNNSNLPDNLVKEIFTKEIVNFNVKIFDNLIMWINTKSNCINTFSNKMTFIEPSENILNLPIFSFNYKEVSKNRMPVLIDKLYDLVSEYSFEIYKITDSTQFVIETEITTGIKKKYFLTKNLESVKKYCETK